MIHFANFLDPLGGLRHGAADVAILYGESEQAGIELRPLLRTSTPTKGFRDYPDPHLVGDRCRLSTRNRSCRGPGSPRCGVNFVPPCLEV